MKTHFKSYFLLFLIALFFTSCQDEVVELITPEEQGIIVANSTLSNLMFRASANSVAADNVVDNSSCFSVELPVTVIVGNITITIENEEGFDELEEILDNFDDEIPAFVFPITIISSDYTETVIQNQDQLEALLDDCIEDDDVIECIDFVFPISFSVLNTDFVIIDTVIIENNEELYDFIDDLDDDANLVSLNFPVTLINANGDTQTVNSNDELSMAIQNASDDCDNDDVFADCDVNEIEISLKECVWEIDDEVNDFDDLYIDFNDDFTLQITGDDLQQAISGNWAVTQTDGQTFLVLSELSSLQEDLEGEWLITECDDDELYITRNGINLELDKDCNEADCNTEEVKDYLQTCIWNAVDVTGNTQLVDYDLDFKDEGVLLVTASNGESVTGNWAVVSVTEGIFLNIEGINGSNIQAINGYWKLFECDDDRLEFTIDNMFIILEQDCDNDDDNDDAFDCFDDFDAYIQLCDDNNDGFEVFDLTTAYANCAPSADMVSYYVTLNDAETASNPITNPQAFTNTTAPQTIYVRVEIDNEVEVFEIELKLENCNDGICTESELVNRLKECEWDIESYAGDSSFDIFYFDFMENDELIVASDNESYTGNWTTDTDGDVFLEFSNISGGNVTIFNGINFRVVECTATQVILHDVTNSNNELVLEKDCE